MNRELQLAEAIVRETGANLFLTGKAGTGKTTFLHGLSKVTEKRFVVTAPTGVAAINAGGVTLHSFFQLPFGPYLADAAGRHYPRFNREKLNLIKNLDLLVIDEISMVRADLLDGVDDVLRRLRRSNLPFGGVQLLLIGDVYQLPPVVKDNEWQLLENHYRSPYFFHSLALGKTELQAIELQHVYRQADSAFIDLLNRVRDSRIDDRVLDALNARLRSEVADLQEDGYITLCTHNSRADGINRSRLSMLGGREYRFSAEVEGDFPEHSYPTGESLELKLGAQVMFLRNDPSPEKNYYNGKIGKITDISDKEIVIRCPGEDKIFVEAVEWENKEYRLDGESMEIREITIGTFRQFPLKLAWAITIHKSQGLTFDQAIIDAQAAFAHGQVYVALSRCRTLDGLVLLSRLDDRAIRTDPAVQQFAEHCRKTSPTPEKLEAAKLRYQQQLLLSCFDFGRLRFLLGRLLSMVRSSGELIRLTGLDDADTLQHQFQTAIYAVGDSFKRQLQSLFSETTLPAQDPVIEERLVKAADYFTAKLDEIMVAGTEPLAVETDNKEMRRKVNDTLKNLRLEIVVKRAAVTACRPPFSPSRYLRAIGSAEFSWQNKRSSKPSPTYDEKDVDHPELLQRLKEWRLEKSRQENLAPFQVMHQKTLIQVAVNLPATLAALKKIKGIGKKLAARYGEEVIALVAAYRAAHDIDEATLHVAGNQGDESTAGTDAKKEEKEKKPTRLISLELFAQGRDCQQVAKARGFAVTTIEGHLAQCVARGELDVERLLSAERLATLLPLIRPLRRQLLKEIKDRLGPDVSYGEIRFVLAHVERLDVEQE